MTDMENDKVTFDNLPEMVNELKQELSALKEMVATLLTRTTSLPSGQQPTAVEVPYKHVLCDIDRACEITNYSKSAMYEYARKTDMPGIKKVKKWTFYEDELAAWMETGRKCEIERENEQLLTNIRSSIKHKPRGNVHRILSL